MAYQQNLQASLEAVSSHATQLLEYLKTHTTPEIDTSGLPRDPFDSAPKSIKVSRKKFTEASASLVGLGTRPEEYLEHLQNGVSPTLLFRGSCSEWEMCYESTLRFIPLTTWCWADSQTSTHFERERQRPYTIRY